jgi:hypothetical protein
MIAPAAFLVMPLEAAPFATSTHLGGRTMYHPRIHLVISVLVVVFALAIRGSAQITYTYDVSSPGIVEAMNLDSAAFPDGAPTLDPLLPAPLPNAGLLPPAIFPAGAQAHDDATRIIYTTDGFAIARDYAPHAFAFGGAGAPLGPPVAPVIPPPFAGPLTGLAMDSVGGVLWACDPFAAIPLSPLPPHAPLGPPVTFPVIPFGSPPMVGLGFESATGTLWSVDSSGAVFNITTAGVPVGPQPVTVVPSVIGFLMNGLTVNTTNGPGAFGAPLCSPETGGQHIVITDGVYIYDAVPGISPPLPIVGTSYSGLGVVGLAYASEAQVLPGAAACPTSGATPMAGTLAPNWVGGGAFNALMVTGAPPMTALLLVADLCPIPGGAFIAASGETLWVSTLTPTAAVGGAVSDAAGTAMITVPFAIAPHGVEFTFQWGIPDPLAPLGACLSDACLVRTGLL